MLCSLIYLVHDSDVIEREEPGMCYMPAFVFPTLNQSGYATSFFVLLLLLSCGFEKSAGGR